MPTDAKARPLTATPSRSGRSIEMSRADLTAMAAKKRLARTAAFGACVALLANAPDYRDMTIADPESLVLTAIAIGQYRRVETKPSEKGPGGVAGMMLFAGVPPEVAARLAQIKTHPAKLMPQEWTSGDLFKPILALDMKATVAKMMAIKPYSHNSV